MHNSYDTSEVIPLMLPNHGIPATLPDTRKSYQKKLALYIILISILFERIAFYSIASASSFTLQSNQTFNWSSQHTSIATYIFSGTSYLSTLIFAVISDAKLGRAKTIIVGFLLYSIGYILMTIITIKKPLCFGFDATKSQKCTANYIGDQFCSNWMLTTLRIIGIGSGAVKSNMAVFGAEQMQQSKLTSHYFDAYVLFVNIGAAIETLIIPYFQAISAFSYDNDSYILAASALGIAFLLFLSGWKYYIHPNLYETVVTNCIPVIINAYKTRSQYKQKKCTINKEEFIASTSSLVNQSNSLTNIEESIREEDDHASNEVLDFAKAVNGGKYPDRIVDDVKSLRNAIILFSLLVPYWLLYNQIDTAFPTQAQQMNGTQNQPYIIAWMSLGDSAPSSSVILQLDFIIRTSILFKLVDILISLLFVKKHFSVQNLTIKLAIGMFFGFLSMVVAGGLEILRQKECNAENPISSLSIYTTIPQNILLGFSQLFALISNCEYAYFGAPRSGQSLFMSLHFCSIGISSFLGAAYTAIFSWHISSQKPPPISLFQCPSQSETYWSFSTYFFILAGLQFLFLLIFIFCQTQFHLIKLNPQQKEIKQFVQS